MVRKNIPGPEHPQFDFTPQTNPEVIDPTVASHQPALSKEDWDREVRRIYIDEIRQMLKEKSQEAIDEKIKSRIQALGAKPVSEMVEAEPVSENIIPIESPSKTEIEIKDQIKDQERALTAAEKYDKDFSELVSEIFDQIESNYPSQDMALAQAKRKASQKLGSRPKESVNLESNLDILESKWLGYFTKPVLINMLNAAGKLNMASGRVAQGIVHIDNPSITMKRRGADVYRPIEAEVKYLVSRGVLKGDVRDLSVAMFQDFFKDFGGRKYGGALSHPRNARQRETIGSLTNRENMFKESLKRTTNPIEIASINGAIKDLSVKKKAILSTVIKSMSDSEKAEHSAYKNRINLKKSLQK
ncbi:hypothetical protein EBR37_02225 [bacterium]|nr:hypothetical protein [bacterium]